MFRLVTWLLLFQMIVVGQTPAQIEVQLPEGFTISKVAGDELATNIFCMQLNERGDPVVSGPGYIKTLFDTDNDGVFDEAVMFINRPKTGAQGMLFVDNQLFCTGDEGLLHFQDSDGDDVADMDARVVLPMTTGGEHTAHAIRIGPGGWLYVLAGNQTKILDEYVTSPNSPVQKPQAGFLMRLSRKDLGIREIVAHGFRNAYDFDFNSAGELFVYDSDGERDISLPWYRPTRVFQIRAGDHAGWMSASWKRSSDYFDMPTEIGAFGRGSPTGVCCYRTSGFPDEYHDAVFACDWTFGRIHVLKRKRKTRQYDRGSVFLNPLGQFGFAVTDIVVARDGSLLVSVGGRGTEGGVYRISFDGVSQKSEDWALKQIDKKAKSIRSIGENASAKRRGLILEALSNETVMRNDTALDVLEMVVGKRWLYASLNEQGKADYFAFIAKSLQNNSSAEARLLLTMVKEWPTTLSRQFDEYLSENTVELSLSSRLLLQSAHAESEADRRSVLLECIDHCDDFGELGTAPREGQNSRRLQDNITDAIRLIRLAQLAMGGCGADQKTPAVFHGYTAKNLIRLEESHIDAVVDSLATSFERLANQPEAIHELLRLIAMLGKQLPADLRFEKPITTSVIDEVHWLICAAQTNAKFSENDIVKSLLSLNEKIVSEKRNTDRNWNSRIEEMAVRLVANYELSSKLVNHSDYGQPGHTFLHKAISNEHKVKSVDRFEQVVANNPDKATIEQLRIILERRPDRSLIRSLVDKRGLRQEALIALAENPDPNDISLYQEGLKSINRTVLKRCATALIKVQSAPSKRTQTLAYHAASRLGWDFQESTVRDELVRLLQKQLGQNFNYQFKASNKIQSVFLDDVGNVLMTKYPDDESLKAVGENVLEQTLAKVDWDLGNRERGLVAFEKFQCVRCHGGGSRLGPSLAGVSKRFSRNDLIRSVIYPNEQVSDRYRGILVGTSEGLVHRGVVIYESVDGITLLEDTGKTIRINRDDIESRRRSVRSLMPEGLMNEASPQEFADLFKYMQQL